MVAWRGRKGWWYPIKGWSYQCQSSDDDDDDDDDDAAHVVKVEIASHIFRNYYCAFHGEYSAGNFGWWFFAKKGLEVVLF